MKIIILIIVAWLCAITVHIKSTPPDIEEPVKPEPVVIFTPDTVRIEVGGQVFRYGQLTILTGDTVTLGAFLPEVDG